MVTSTTAPKRHRPKATPKGVKKPSDSLIKMNEQPQMMEVPT
jgi:hypothetical protein